MRPTRRITPLVRVLPRIAASELAPPAGVRAMPFRFGDHHEQYGIAYLPKDDGADRPWVYFLHGGGWRSGNPRQYAFVGRFFAAKGFATVLGGYRLAPRHHWPAQLEDAAVGLVAACELDGLRRRPVVLAGFSAGGHLAAMLAEGAAGELPVPAAGLFLLSAPVDFSRFQESPYIEGLTGHDSPWPEADPMAHLDGPLPPLLIAQGAGDQLVPPDGPLRFAGAAERSGSRLVEYLELPWAHHADSLDVFLRPTDEGTRVLDWLSGLDTGPQEDAAMRQGGKQGGLG